jgi:hypothetical protein
MKCYERAKVKTLLEGDNNTCFFHLVANGKHRKQYIFKLEQDDDVIVGDDNLKNTSPTTTKDYLTHQMKMVLLWLRTKLMIFHK